MVEVTEYVIYPVTEGEWCLRVNGKKLVLFPTRQEALQTAIAIATVTGDRPSVVLEEAGGQLTTIWRSE
jgi:hypothetical protein